MTDPAIKAALEAATDAAINAQPLCFTGDLAPLSKCVTTKAWRPCRCQAQAAAAVAAFLRRLPDLLLTPTELFPRQEMPLRLHALAAAVEKEAAHD